MVKIHPLLFIAESLTCAKKLTIGRGGSLRFCNGINMNFKILFYCLTTKVYP